MNVEKMRRQLYRELPDTMVIVADPLYETVDYTPQIQEFGAKMKKKYGDRFQSLNVRQSERDWDTGKIRITVETVLRR